MENAKQITLNSLLSPGNLAQNEELFDQIVSLRDKALKDSRIKPGAAVLTSCNHFVSDPNQLRRSHGGQVYSSLEVPCPVCKRPSNTLLPIIRRDFFDFLNGSSTEVNTAVGGLSLSSLVTHLLQKAGLAADQMVEETPISKHLDRATAYAEDGLWRVLKEEAGSLESFYTSNITNYLTFTDLLERGGGKTQARQKWMNNQEILQHSLSYLLRYLELSGLAAHVTEFSQVYHNFYLLLRADFLGNSKQEASHIFEEGLRQRTVRFLSLLAIADQNSASFLQADIEELFANAVPLLVGFLII